MDLKVVREWCFTSYVRKDWIGTLAKNLPQKGGLDDQVRWSRPDGMAMTRRPGVTGSYPTAVGQRSAD